MKVQVTGHLLYISKIYLFEITVYFNISNNSPENVMFYT